jgi:hypothetical protein
MDLQWLIRLHQFDDLADSCQRWGDKASSDEGKHHVLAVADELEPGGWARQLVKFCLGKLR